MRNFDFAPIFGGGTYTIDAQVPEPATLSLLLGGGAMALLRRRRRQ